MRNTLFWSSLWRTQLSTNYHQPDINSVGTRGETETMADAHSPSIKADDGNEPMTEEPRTGGSAAAASNADKIEAGESVAEDAMGDVTMSGGTSTDKIMTDGTEEDDPKKTFDGNLTFDDLPTADRHTRTEPNEHSPDPDPDSSPDIEMTDAGTDPFQQPSPTSTHSSDAEISLHDVLMGNVRREEGLLYMQFKCTPPLIPIEVWSPWLFTINPAIDALVRESISQIAFLEYIVLCRTASHIPSRHPEPFSCIVFVIENCFKSAHRAVVMRVDDEVLHYILEPETMEEMQLSCFEEHEELADEGVFRTSKPQRAQQFGEWLATGRSEEKLTHTVKGYLLMDQGSSVKIAPKKNRTFQR